MTAGQSAGVSIYLSSSEGVTNLLLTLPWAGDRFTNASLTVAAPQIGSQTLQDLGTHLVLGFQTTPGQVLQGTQYVAELNFGSVSNQHSALFKLPAAAIQGVKPDGLGYAYYVQHPGMVTIFADNPLLWANGATYSGNNSTLFMTLYGKPGVNYQLQYSTNLSRPGNWYPLFNYTQTNDAMSVGLDSTNQIILYRVFQP